MTDSADDDGRRQTEQEPQASASPHRVLTAAAERALAEAEDRRREAETKARLAKEIGGRDGPDPVRYGDWEVKGIASDF